MKRLRKLSVAIIVLAMCILLGSTAWAAETDVSVICEAVTVCPGTEAQTVTLTFKADREIDIVALTAVIDVPDLWKVTGIANGKFDTKTDDSWGLIDASTGDANISWSSDDITNVNTDVLAVVTVRIPAGATSECVEFTVVDMAYAEYDGEDLDIVEYSTPGPASVSVNVVHTFGETTAAKGATCLAPGNSAYKQCTACEKYFAANAETTSTATKDSAEAFKIAQKDHSYTGEIKSNGNGKDATHSFKCVNGCNQYGEAVEHTWNAGVPTPDSDCTNTGTKIYTCTAEGCGATYTEDIAAKGHTFGETTEYKAATCIATGNEAYKQCTVCNKYFAADAAVNSTEEKDDTTSFVIGIDANAHAYPETPSSYTNNGDGTHTANYVCGNNPEHTKSDAPVEHTYNQENDTKCVCGAVELTVTYKGAALANAFTVDGNVITVTFDKACKLGYWDAENNKYVAIAATHVEGNTYTFTAPEGVTEVLLVVKGDVDGSGMVNLGDRLRLAQSMLPATNTNRKVLTEAWEIFAAEVDGVGTVNLGDRLRLAQSMLPPTNANCKALTW